MKKILFIFISLVLFCGCKINGYNAEDGTFLAGKGHYLDLRVFNFSYYVDCEREIIPENIEKPYIIFRWIDNEGLIQNPTLCSEENASTVSFEIVNFVVHNQKEKRIGSDLLNNSILEFTLYPKEGDPIKVDSSGVVWKEGGKNTWFDFTVDFDNKKFIANELL